MTLTTAAGKLGDKARYVENIHEYVNAAQRADVRVTQCITDAKGDRSLRPSRQGDPDAFVHVVDRGPDGVVLRGAKLHITGASLGHDLMTIPTKAMKDGEAEYAIGCAVPVSSPGIKIIDVTYAPTGRDLRNYPISGFQHFPESFVIFDDVFVPNDKIFLDGEVSLAGTFAHSLGLWERMAGIANMADSFDALVGFAQLIAEANGLAGVAHIKDKISEMIICATLIRSSLESAIFHCVTGPDGAVFPNELYVNAGKYHGASSFSLMARHLHDIAGASVITAPSIGDLENDDTGPLVRKYMQTMPGVDGEYRLRLFHAIRDLTADSYGGWRHVATVQAGGGLYAQRVVTRKHYDMDGAKRVALRQAGIDESLAP
jgi:4-hydroxybutyryl-CoA dehydratase/vinylacetyl-CoA-Delta-isomerase